MVDTRFMSLLYALDAVDFPAGIEFYNIEGMRLFPIYGPEGGIGPYWILYIIRKGSGKPSSHDLGRERMGVVDVGGGWKSHAVEFNSLEQDEKGVLERVDKYTALLQASPSEGGE